MIPITVVLPDKFSSISAKFKEFGEIIVEYETYQKLDKEHLKRVTDEGIILISEYEVFKTLSNNPFLKNEINGKILLVSNSNSLPTDSLTLKRGVFVVPQDNLEINWTFHIGKLVEEFKFDWSISSLKDEDLKKQQDIDTLNDLGVALSTENDLDKLLDLIVSKAREMTWADGGSLYLVVTDPDIPEDPNDYMANKKMRFQVAQNDSRDVPFKSSVVDISKKSIYGYVAITQEVLNFTDSYYLDKDKEYSWGGREFDKVIDYRTMSMLTVPLIDWKGETIGVLQLINSKKRPEIKLEEPETCTKDIRPFVEHDAHMVRSIASQASISIQNTQLINSIRGLFNGFIAASVKAIEARDPTTSGHSQRVAELTVALAEQVDRSNAKPFKEVKFDTEGLQEIRYASLLHDFGKIGVREHVLIKAKKLFPHQMQAVKDRFEFIRRTVSWEFAEKQVKLLLESDKKGTNALLAEINEKRDLKLKETDDLLAFILQCNEPTVLAQGGFDQLKDIANFKINLSSGKEIPYLNEEEMVSLSVPKGSLNEDDRREIESHVTHTYRFLSTIPWTSDLRRVPEIAYAHHEKLDGTGYPQKLKSDEISIQSKMMSISDIFDALTAMDRPYKKALPADRALNILLEESKVAHIDGELLKIFIESDIYKLVN